MGEKYLAGGHLLVYSAKGENLSLSRTHSKCMVDADGGRRKRALAPLLSRLFSALAATAHAIHAFTACIIVGVLRSSLYFLTAWLRLFSRWRMMKHKLAQGRAGCYHPRGFNMPVSPGSHCSRARTAYAQR